MSWSKVKEIVMAIGYYSKMSDPIGLFHWPIIGLKLMQSNKIGYMWNFLIVDKKKLSYNMMKYNFTL